MDKLTEEQRSKNRKAGKFKNEGLLEKSLFAFGRVTSLSITCFSQVYEYVKQNYRNFCDDDYLCS